MADQRILASENLIGALHPTLTDTLNRLTLVEHNTDGTHKASITGLTVTATKTLSALDNITLTTTTPSATTYTQTFPNANDTIVNLGSVQTLTNKTLTSPKLNEDVAVTTTATKLNYITSATGTTGTTSAKIVFDTSPTLVTPVLGVATATSINGLTLTTSTGTLTVANGVTLTANATGTIPASSAAFRSDTYFALLAGSSSQAFACSTLTATGSLGTFNVDMNSAAVTLTRADANYIYASNALGDLKLGAGGTSNVMTLTHGAGSDSLVISATGAISMPGAVSTGALSVTGGVGGGVAVHRLSVNGTGVVAVAQSAITIFTDTNPGGLPSGHLSLVTGTNGASNVVFSDLLFWGGSSAPTVVASKIVNTPATRTYAMSGSYLQLTMGGAESYNVSTGTLEQGTV